MKSVVLGFFVVYGSIATGAEMSERQSALSTKIKFFSWLVNDSPTAIRILRSSDTGAIRNLKQARQLLEQARSDYDDGRYPLVEENISAGIKTMTMVSRKIKDERRLQRSQEKLFQELRERIRIFADAFDRVVEEKNNDYVNTMLDREKLSIVIEQAESLHAEERFALANQRLKDAADMVEVALSDARHEDVLLHELSFDSIADEFIYEIKRNESYVMLIRLLQKNNSVSDASRQYVNNIIESNDVVVSEAETYMDRGEGKKAIKILEKSTEKLSRALRMSGAPF